MKTPLAAARTRAVHSGVTDGVWGGTTEDERRVIRSVLRKQRANSATGR
ncbi:MAG: WhiB family transcriptional regulator [Trebonia sp.]